MHGRGRETHMPANREWVKREDETRAMESGSSRAAFAGPAPVSLPGISSLLQPQQHHHHQHHRLPHPHPCNPLYAHAQAHACALSSSLSLYAPRSHAHEPSVPHDAPTPPIQGGSPTLDAFKRIGLTDHQTHTVRAVSSSSLRRSRSTGSDMAAVRTHTSYKPQSTTTVTNGTLTSSASSSSLSSQGRPVRMSRYLRESDRRNILRRIENGEKQADLAKEFQVSRAAISNLKQRRNRKDQALVQETAETVESKEKDVKSARAQPLEPSLFRLGSSSSIDTDDRGVVGPGGQYDGRSDALKSASVSPSSPALSASSSASVSPSSSPTSSPNDRDDGRFRTDSVGPTTMTMTTSIAARVAQLDPLGASLLLSRLIDPRTDQLAFLNAAMRVTRLLLEQALSSLATQPVDIALPTLSPTPFGMSHDRCFYAGVSTGKPVCAVAVTERAIPLLHEFQAMEPTSATGCVAFPVRSPVSGGDSSRSRPLVRLPHDVVGSSVLVLATLLSHHSVHELVATVQVRSVVYRL